MQYLLKHLRIFFFYLNGNIYLKLNTKTQKLNRRKNKEEVLRNVGNNFQIGTFEFSIYIPERQGNCYHLKLSRLVIRRHTIY